MAAKQMTWGAGDRERRQRISHEVRQLKQMSNALRATAMLSFTKRIAAARQDTKRPETPPKPASVAA